MHARDTQFLEFLLDSGLVSQADIRAAEQEAKDMGRDIASLLVHRGKISEADARKIQGHVYGISFIDLDTRSIPFDTLSLIPEPLARTHNAIAYETQDDTIFVALLDLETSTLLEQLFRGQKKIVPRFTTRDSIRHALKQYQGYMKRAYGDTISRESGLLARISANASEKVGEHASAIHIVDALIKHGLISHASHIHIEPYADTLIIRYRIRGRMYDAMTLPSSVARAVVLRLKTLSRVPRTGETLTGGTFKVLLDTEVVTCRTTYAPTLYGEKVLIHIARGKAAGFTCEGLGLHGQGLEYVYEALLREKGMVVVSGGRESGKTTLLYTLLDMLNTGERSLVTVEDPVEYEMSGIMQMRVNTKTGMSYAHVLRGAIRSDADVIMIGDIGAREVADIALRTAIRETAILGGISARGAAHALYELVDKTDKDELLINGGLALIVSTKLIRTLGADKQKYFLTDTDVAGIAKHIDMDSVLVVLKEEGVIDEAVTDWKTIPFYREGEGGFIGITGIHEVLPITHTMKELIMRGASVREFDIQARREGMAGFLEDGLYKAVLGMTTVEEVLKTVSQ